MKKISSFLKTVFGYGIMIALFLGVIVFLGYVIALIIGGDVAAEICEFLYKRIVPVMIYLGTSMVLLGLLAMYFAGEKALTPSKRKK